MHALVGRRVALSVQYRSAFEEIYNPPPKKSYPGALRNSKHPDINILLPIHYNFVDCFFFSKTEAKYLPHSLIKEFRVMFQKRRSLDLFLQKKNKITRALLSWYDVAQMFCAHVDTKIL